MVLSGWIGVRVLSLPLNLRFRVNFRKNNVEINFFYTF